MNVSDWQKFYKYQDNELTTTQMVYTPRISPQGDIFCMDFCYGDEYQTNQYKIFSEMYTLDFVEFMFDRELEYLEKYKNFSWAPEVLDVDNSKRRIFIRRGWNFNHIMQTNDLTTVCPGWAEKIKSIVQEQYDNGLLKLSVYPHSHMIHAGGKITSMDFYACADRENPRVELEKVMPLMGQSAFRFAEVKEGETINLEQMYKNTLEKYHQWPKDIFKDFEW